MMMPLADLFVHVSVQIDDLLKSGAIPVLRRPGPAPAGSAAEVLTSATVRHLLGRRSAGGFLAEVRRDWGQYFPHLPHRSEFNRRVRWLWGAGAGWRRCRLAAVPEDPWQQLDTTTLPVKHPSRVRGPDQWVGPGGRRAGFGRDASPGAGFSGFRLGLRTDLGSRLVRAWEIAPAAVDERRVGDDLLEGARPPAGRLLDRGFVGRDGTARQAERGTRVVIAHSRAERRALPAAVRRPLSKLGSNLRVCRLADG